MSYDRLPAEQQTARPMSKVRESHPIETHRNHPGNPAKEKARAEESLQPLSTRVPQELHERIRAAVFHRDHESKQAAVIAALDYGLAVPKATRERIEAAVERGEYASTQEAIATALDQLFPPA